MYVNHPFEPIYDKNSKILILGSLPSVKSRQDNFYYAHPQNRFWKLIAKIYDSKKLENIEEKREVVLNNNIALWDVIKKCDIKGSSDSSIKDVEINNINNLIKESCIEKIIFNGNKAYELYLRYEKNKFQNLVVLPSTSPANAKFSFDMLFDIWNRELRK